MVWQYLGDLVAINGKVAADIKENRLTLASNLIVFVAGIVYGLVVFRLRAGGDTGDFNSIYLFFAVLMGFLYMVTSQIGITLLLWAMSRIFKGTARFMSLFSAVGYSFLPYGALAVLIAFFNGTVLTAYLPGLLAILLLLWLVQVLAKILHLLEGFSLKKAYFCVIFSMLFFGSFIYVFGY